MLPCYANYFDTRNCILFYIFISATFDASMNPRYALCDMLYRDILLEHKQNNNNNNQPGKIESNILLNNISTGFNPLTTEIKDRIGWINKQRTSASSQQRNSMAYYAKEWQIVMTLDICQLERISQHFIRAKYVRTTLFIHTNERTCERMMFLQRQTLVQLSYCFHHLCITSSNHRVTINFIWSGTKQRKYLLMFFGEGTHRVCCRKGIHETTRSMCMTKKTYDSNANRKSFWTMMVTHTHTHRFQSKYYYAFAHIKIFYQILVGMPLLFDSIHVPFELI